MTGWDSNRAGGAFYKCVGVARRSRARVAGLLVLACAIIAAVAAVTAGAESPVASFAPQGGKLVAEGESGAGRFGRSAALSADGNTALVGAPHNKSYRGAVWVFARSGGDWSAQSLLQATGTTSTYFGRSVALSADGNTAIVGDPGVNESTGDAWIFHHGEGGWALVARLVPSESGAAANFGRSVALSSDGRTALVGAFGDEGKIGSAYAYGEQDGSWQQIGHRLTASDESGAGYFGRSVALSASGKAALIGGSEDGQHRGAAWLFERGGEGFEQIGEKITGGEEEIGRGQFGSGVALSADSSTAVIGAPSDNERIGAAFVFVRSGKSWAQQGPKLVGTGEEGAGSVGYNVAVSSDGRVALAAGLNDSAGAGAVWVFGRSGEAWSQQGSKLTGADEVGPGQAGFGLALSGDGSTALIGGLADSSLAGAVWPFVNTINRGEETAKEGGNPTPGPIKGPVPPATGKGGVLSSVGAPELAQTGNLEPAGGEVWVTLPGTKTRVLLSTLRQVPFGTLIDARKGRVVVIAALPGGGTERGEFFGGQFVLKQGHDGVVFVVLSGGSYRLCPTRKQRAQKAAYAAGGRRRSVRHLWANAHGTFTTRGSYAAGAVQGTEWLTEDRCEGTYIKVTRDKVLVTDLVRHRTKTVLQGHAVLVRPR